MRTEVAKDSYGASVMELARRGAPVRYAGDFLVAVDHDRPTGYYETDRDGLRWREAAPFNTVQFDVAVADANDGRFVPGLTVALRAEKNGRTLAAGECLFRWHPRLHRYAVDLRLLPGRYDVTVHIGTPVFQREDHAAGRRYSDPVVLRFPNFEVCRIGAV
jgi:hypothetical protein